MKSEELLRNEFRNTIAIMGSVDTKEEEILYARKTIESGGCKSLIIDMSTLDISGKLPGIGPLQILAEFGVTQEAFRNMTKPEKVEHMRMAVEALLPRLYKEQKFQGVISIGGGQNARMAADAMKKLPFGVPKLLASSLICGERTLEQFIGTKDMLVMHTVADMEGLNVVTKTVIQNACNAIIGMVTRRKSIAAPVCKTRIAITTLGITTEGAHGVRSQLPEEDYEVTCFHANGVGGRCMEELMSEKIFDMIVDMNLHEIACEQFGGYSRGANCRLEKTIAQEVPLLVIPGAVDMLDCFMEEGENPEKYGNGRKYVFHNTHILHMKTTREEVVQLAEVIAKRLNQGMQPITVILPHGGFSSETAPGQPLYDPEVDEAFIEVLKRELKKEIRVLDVPGNINGPDCQNAIVQEIKNISQKGKENYEKEVC